MSDVRNRITPVYTDSVSVKKIMEKLGYQAYLINQNHKIEGDSLSDYIGPILVIFQNEERAFDVSSKYGVRFNLYKHEVKNIKETIYSLEKFIDGFEYYKELNDRHDKLNGMIRNALDNKSDFNFLLNTKSDHNITVSVNDFSLVRHPIIDLAPEKLQGSALLFEAGIITLSDNVITVEGKCNIDGIVIGSMANKYEILARFGKAMSDLSEAVIQAKDKYVHFKSGKVALFLDGKAYDFSIFEQSKGWWAVEASSGLSQQSNLDFDINSIINEGNRNHIGFGLGGLQGSNCPHIDFLLKD